MRRLHYVLPMLLLPLMLGAGVGHANPYIAGYSSTPGLTPASQIYDYVNFAGTSLSSLTSYVLAVDSTAELDSSSHLNGFIAQQENALNPGRSDILGQVEILGPNSYYWGCRYLQHGCPSLGQFSSINYVYYTMYWSASNQITAYFQTTLNGGGGGYQLFTYTEQSGDNSRYFAAGVQNIGGISYKYLL